MGTNGQSIPSCGTFQCCKVYAITNKTICCWITLSPAKDVTDCSCCDCTAFALNQGKLAAYAIDSVQSSRSKRACDKANLGKMLIEQASWKTRMQGDTENKRSKHV